MTGHLTRRSHVFAGALVTGFLLVASASAAFALWTVPTSYAPTNHAAATAGSLLPPAAATATADGDSSITVGWTPAAGQPAGVEHRVIRTSGPGSLTTVCTVAAPVTSCTDGSLAPGTPYGYSVEALLGAWRSPAATASATTSKAAQSITFTSAAPQNSTVGGATYTAAASASSGLTVSFSLAATSSGCTLSGATVTFTAAGTCRIAADQAGNGQYLAAPQVQQTINVTNPVAGIAFTNVRVNGTLTTPTCTGTIGSTWTCQVTGGNNASVTANVGFVNAFGTAAVFSSQPSSLTATQTGKNAGTATVSIAGGQTTSTATTGAQKNGSNSAQVTVTFGGWTAVLVIS